MQTNCAQLQPGFTDTVHDAQKAYRVLLKVMSEPGRIGGLPPHISFGSLHSATSAILLTLVDMDTPLWIDPALSSESTLRNLRFHCGCPVSNHPVSHHGQEVAFLITRGSGSLKPESCNSGDPAYPDKASTVILQVDQIQGSNDRNQSAGTTVNNTINDMNRPSILTLTGPGICGHRTIRVSGLSRDWLQWLSKRQRQFPLAMDLFLVSQDRVMAIPRSTRVSLHSAATILEAC